jgi:hypothetical protein
MTTIPEIIDIPVSTAANNADRRTLLEELELKVNLIVEGVSIDSRLFSSFPIGTSFWEQQHSGHNHRLQSDSLLPYGFYLPHGLFFGFRWDDRSRFRLQNEDGNPVLYEGDNRLAEVEFLPRPALLDAVLESGEKFRSVGNPFREGGFTVCYSVECSLKDKNQDCLFCNINKTAGLPGREIFTKSPNQIAQAYKLARAAGFAGHLNLTGGFVPERREVEYYLDVADAIKEKTSVESINGTAVIGAPSDLKVIEKYKEAGFKTVAINIEIWNKDIFKAICPGKEQQAGGWQHWVDAIVYAAEVFGHGNVRSNIVGGIEPKPSTLEGIEFLASKGAICFASIWQPNVGSGLEGHRTPEPAWHFDLIQKIAAIHHKYGFTTRNLHNALGFGGCVHDAFRILGNENDGGYLEPWVFPQS